LPTDDLYYLIVFLIGKYHLVNAKSSEQFYYQYYRYILNNIKIKFCIKLF